MHLQTITAASKLYFYTARQINHFIYLENTWGYPSQRQSHWKQNISKGYTSPLSRIGLLWNLMQFLKSIVSGISLFATREFTLVQIVTNAFTCSGVTERSYLDHHAWHQLFSLSTHSGIINSGHRVLFGIRNPGLIPTYNSPTLNEYKITTNVQFWFNNFCTSQKQIKKNEKSSKDSDLNYTEFFQTILLI